MIPRDKYYNKLLDNRGTLFCGYADDELVTYWNEINPIIMSQQFIENLDYDLDYIERLPNRAMRICQYRFDFLKVYPEYEIVLFTVTYLYNSMSNSYWNKLTEWLVYQGYSSDNPVS